MGINKIIKITILIIFSLIFCLLSYKLCYFVAEKYYFDKFFYQKSLNHGYWLIDNTYSDFGNRTKDVKDLISGNKKILPINKNEPYKIAIIGDSYVWGQGIRSNQRFSILLENKLNKIKKTKVYSFGNCGDNIFENYIKYQQSIDIFGQMDLYIFALVENDLLFNTESFFSAKNLINKYQSICQGQAIYKARYDEQIANPDLYTNSVANSLKNTTQNFCIFQKIVSLYPKEKTIFFDVSAISDSDSQIIFSKLISENFSPIVIPPIIRGDQSLWVSNSENHPSILANKIFSDTLYKEITTNYKWKFTHE